MQKLAALSIIPIFGWLAAALIAVIAAIPFHFLWSWLAPIYFVFLPVTWINMNFLDTAGMLVLIGFVKILAFPRTAKKGNKTEG